MDKEILKKFEEIKRVAIIKNFKPIFRENQLVDIDVEFFDYLSPSDVLFKLDSYIFEKYSLII